MTQVRDEARRRPPDTVIGPYRLAQKLGEGGMGVVYLALDRQGRAVAMKVLRRDIAHDPAARERLRREVATLARITHPSVAGVIDADIDGDQPYLVTRYVPGPSLDDVVRDTGALDANEVALLAAGLAEALEAIHDAGVVHRDVKPGNVLLVDGEPVLIDFGIAHIADDTRLTSTGLVMGTPGYLSPEIIDGAHVSPATDWWGWAATVGYAALGRPPFGTGPMDVVLSRVSRGAVDLSGMDARLAPLIAAALDPDPQARPSAHEVLVGIEAYADGGAVTDVVAFAPSSSTVPTSVLPQGATRALPQDQRSGPSQGAGTVTSAGQVPGQAVGIPVPGDHADPRIGRAKHSGVLAVLALALSVGAALAPIVTAALIVALMILARISDKSVTSLVLRRYQNGPRRRDIPVSVIAGPWHVMVAVVATALGLALPAVVFGATTFAVALTLQLWTPLPHSPLDPIPMGIATVLALWVAWWGPGGAGLRRGSRSLVRGVTGSDAAAQVLTALLLLIIVALLAVLVIRTGGSIWWPLTRPPSLLGVEPTGFTG